MSLSTTSELCTETVKAPPQAKAIEAKALKKTYRIYSSPIAHVAEAIGLPRWKFKKAQPRKEFVALDDIDLTIDHGERVGIIGRNGAGKTTLLKLITGVVEPTSGSIRVNGNVQALMQIGMGFHPELSGLENIHGALIYSGLAGTDLKRAVDDVVAFAELNEFLERPLKTYSLGMKSRLQFAAATAVRPEVLIVDEILGAGDAYFAVKSAERMRRLTEGGCTLLLVSHAMTQVHQFCRRAIWMEKGRIRADGAPAEVINSYEEFIGRFHAESTRATMGGANGPMPDWLREKLIREALEAREVQGTNPQGSEYLTTRGARWDGPGPLRIQQIRLLDSQGEPTSRLAGPGSFGVEVAISTEAPGSFRCTTIVFIYHEHGHTIARAYTEPETLHVTPDKTTSRTAWFDRNFLGGGRYMISAGLYRQFDVLAPDAAQRYDILSKAANFEVVGLPNDPSLIRIDPVWR